MSLNKKYILSLLILGVLFFFPFLGNVHLFDWDEINFAESAREMLQTGDYFRVQINYEPFWEKPPLFFWLQAASMKLFGVNEFAARFPNALLGAISLITLYFIGKKIISKKFGFIWSLVYFASFLPHLYFKSGIIDPLFNFFIFLSIYFLILTINKPTSKNINALFSGVLIGLAIITKGPVALLLLILTLVTYLILKRFKKKIKISSVIIFFLSSLGVSFLWFGYETITHSPWFILEFIEYQIELLTEPVAGHEQPFYYHFLVVLLGCFPMSILAIPAFRKKTEVIPYDFLLWMKILFWVVMIVFTIVKTKIVHYSSMSYLPLSFLAATLLYSFWEERENIRINKFLKISYLAIGIIFGILLTLTPILFANSHWITPYIKDDFAAASLNYDMQWQGWEFIFGVFFIIGLIISYRYLSQVKITKFILSISLITGFTLMGYAFFVVPKIEKFSQGPAIGFYKSLEGKDVYVSTHGFKSYAPFFYTKFPPRKHSDGIEKVKQDYKNSLSDPKEYDPAVLKTRTNNWLMKGNIDKNVYIVTKITSREEMENYPELKFIKNEGGFNFYLREKSTP